MQVKIPVFLSKKLASCQTKDEKDNLIAMYKSWCESTITKEFKAGLQKEWEICTEKEDNKSDFISRFQLTFSSGIVRGTRKALKNVIKQLNYEV